MRCPRLLLPSPSGLWKTGKQTGKPMMHGRGSPEKSCQKDAETILRCVLEKNRLFLWKSPLCKEKYPQQVFHEKMWKTIPVNPLYLGIIWGVCGKLF